LYPPSFVSFPPLFGSTRDGKHHRSAVASSVREDDDDDDVFPRLSVDLPTTGVGVDTTIVGTNFHDSIWSPSKFLEDRDHKHKHQGVLPSISTGRF
jgi:hypothetical protein